MAIDIPIPQILKETTEDIHARMLDSAPANINKIEGDIFWDATRPSAEEKAKLINIQMQNILRMAFPQSAKDVYLEYLGECKGVFKNPATKAIGNIKVIGEPNTLISKGKVFSTVATDEKESIDYEVLETKKIDETGSVIVKVRCLQAGKVGNVQANTITIVATYINGIKSITNEENFTGGTDIEDEEHFRERVIAAEQEENLSGADSDYIRWAKEVPGVGNAYVVPEWDGAGTVKLLILDKNGHPANKELIDAVQNYIAPEGKNRGGKAPIGALVTVNTPTVLQVNIKAKFKFKEGFDSTDILNNLKAKISNYLSNIAIGGTVLFNAIHTIVGSMILTGEGVEDFESLTINDISGNIKLTDQVATVGEVINIE